MKLGFYAKLARMGMVKNKRLYLPYLLTCAGMVMMYYIVAFLSASPVLDNMYGGSIVATTLTFGTWVIGIFSAIFLLYTNSFLMRRRKKEFGLYNILGMEKRHIARILIWETVLSFVGTFLVGTAAGVALSKFAELAMINVMRGDVNYTLSLSTKSIRQAFEVFAVIFIIILLSNLRQVHTANPIALLRSESAGEKPPKANWLCGVLGVIVLAGAYYLAVTIEDPVTAMVLFFVAVIMVIVATYLLFIAGSVVLCRFLQKNKGYYYKANHFVSVSSMAHRMTRNGAGLASICILITMVLVIVSSTTCMYIGSEDVLTERHPTDLSVTIGTFRPEQISDEAVATYTDELAQVIATSDVTPENLMYYRSAETSGYLTKDGVLELDVQKYEDMTLSDIGNVTQLQIIPLSDYNRISGENRTLAPDQALLYNFRGSYTLDTFSIAEGGSYHIQEVLPTFFLRGDLTASIFQSICLVVPDLDTAIAPLATLANFYGDPMVNYCFVYGFDSTAPDSEQIALRESLFNRMYELRTQNEDSIHYTRVESIAVDRVDYYGTFGSLFFLGIILSVAFIFAAILIIYYKQISEGYEDKARFAIMKKVGMTERDIRKSINSQMLTVFYLPLVTAGIHLTFAFPMVRKILVCFNLVNTPLFILTTVISFLVFALFYMVVYRITSSAYFSIVNTQS